MKKTLSLFIGATLACGVVANAQDKKEAVEEPAKVEALKLDTHDDAMAAMIEFLEEFTTEMEGVTDKTSAIAAKPKLEKLNAKRKLIEAAMDKLGEPGAEKEAELKAKYEPKMKPLMGRLMGAMMKAMMDEEIKAALGDTLK